MGMTEEEFNSRVTDFIVPPFRPDLMKIYRPVSQHTIWANGTGKIILKSDRSYRLWNWKSVIGKKCVRLSLVRSLL